MSLNILNVIPQELKKQLYDTLIDFIYQQAHKFLGSEIAGKIKKLRSDRAFRKSFDSGLQKAAQRFIAEYESVDEDLVAAVSTDNSFFQNEEVQAALLTILKNPGRYLTEEQGYIAQSFTTILPNRKNRERVDRAVSYFLRCLVEELWHLPELQPIYSLQFQRLTAEAVRSQLSTLEIKFFDIEHCQR